MSHTKTHYSCAELAALKLPNYPATERAWRDLVDRQAWSFNEIKSRGRRGIRREYQPPDKMASEINKYQSLVTVGAESKQLKAIKAVIQHEAEVDRSSRQDVDFNEVLARLTPEGQEKFGYKMDIVLAWKSWCSDMAAAGAWIGLEDGKKRFCDTYNEGGIEVPHHVQMKAKKLTKRTLERYIESQSKRGALGYVDARHLKNKPGRKMSIFELYPALEKYFIALLTDKPHIKNTHLVKLLNHSRVVKESGECLWPKVSYDAICRHRTRFEEEHKQAFEAVKSPGGYKNKFMAAFGNLSGDVERYNQCWELDGTPADWLFVDGRHNASVVIDIWSRRVMIRFSKTPRTETNKLLLRDALLEWGVPEVCATDHGSDYKSREFRLALEQLGIEHHITDAYSPWQKGHVERFIKTYLHSVLEVLDNFEGHNVAEKKEINDRRSFADQLFKKNEVVKVNMTAAEFQVLTEQWIDGTYMHDLHSTLGMTPFNKVSSWQGATRQIKNEHALDILLFKPGGRPIVGKKGIRYDNAHFIHAELGELIGYPVEISLDPNDIGRIYVYREGKFICVAECPERTGINQAEIAAHARHLQNKAVDWKKKGWKKDSNSRLLTTDEVVKDLTVKKAEEAGKLTHLKRTEPYRTPFIEEAEKAARALDIPSVTDDAPALSAEDSQALVSILNPKAEVIDLASRRPALPAMLERAENPIPGLSDAEKYDAWHLLNERVKTGCELKHDWQRVFHAHYPGSPAFDSERAMRQASNEKTEGV